MGKGGLGLGFGVWVVVGGSVYDSVWVRVRVRVSVRVWVLY